MSDIYLSRFIDYCNSSLNEHRTHTDQAAHLTGRYASSETIEKRRAKLAKLTGFDCSEIHSKFFCGSGYVGRREDAFKYSFFIRKQILVQEEKTDIQDIPIPIDLIIENSNGEKKGQEERSLEWISTSDDFDL